MSLYSSQSVKTHYLEPSLHNSSRGTEFRIKHKGKILPNLRLLDVGYLQTSNNTVSYNLLGGVKSMIKNIHLYDGKTSLSSLLDAPQYQAFKMYNKPVSTNKSLEQALNQSNNSVIGVNEHLEDNILKLFQDKRTSSTNNTDTCGKGWIDLRDYFPVLKSLNNLDTEVFSNLRVVMEYELGSDSVVSQSNTPGSALSPRLVIDVIEEPEKAAPNPEVVSYMEIENDTFEVPNAGNASQTVNARLNGFSNKSVGRMLFVKQLQDTDTYINSSNVLAQGKLGSVAQQDELVQLTINGTQRFPRDGLSTKGNRGLAQVVDTWGECSSFPFVSQALVQNIDEVHSSVQNMMGNLSYVAYDNAGDRIQNMEVSYKRKGNTSAGAPLYVSNAALNVRCYGEVAKTLMFKGNDYNIIYN